MGRGALLFKRAEKVIINCNTLVIHHLISLFPLLENGIRLQSILLILTSDTRNAILTMQAGGGGANGPGKNPPGLMVDAYNIANG